MAAGKKHAEGKLTGKKKRKLLDLKKRKEKIKFLGGLAAEATAVQAELVGEMEEKLRCPSNLQALQLTQRQLRMVNMVAKLMNHEVDHLAQQIIAQGRF